LTRPISLARTRSRWREPQRRSSFHAFNDQLTFFYLFQLHVLEI